MLQRMAASGACAGARAMNRSRVPASCSCSSIVRRTAILNSSLPIHRVEALANPTFRPSPAAISYLSILRTSTGRSQSRNVDNLTGTETGSSKAALALYLPGWQLGADLLGRQRVRRRAPAARLRLRASCRGVAGVSARGTADARRASWVRESPAPLAGGIDRFAQSHWGHKVTRAGSGDGAPGDFRGGRPLEATAFS